MSISVHIYDGGASDAAAGSAPAGALEAATSLSTSGELPADGALALDAGPPDAALVQEVESALLLARAATGGAETDGDAGAAPA